MDIDMYTSVGDSVIWKIITCGGLVPGSYITSEICVKPK